MYATGPSAAVRTLLVASGGIGLPGTLLLLAGSLVPIAAARSCR